MSEYYRPLVQNGPARPDTALPLVGGSLWFTHAERLGRDGRAELVAASELPGDTQVRLTSARLPVAGLDMSQPQVMGILNVTPDSFSDGGQHEAPGVALSAAMEMVAAGAAMIDIGGESTRPGAAEVPEAEEVARTAPVIAAIRAESDIPISVDTRKLMVAQAAVAAGANLINDVSGLTFDPMLAPYCSGAELPVCVMHSQGDPATMQDDPCYDDVLLDVYDFLEDRIVALEAAGVPRARILADPGLGFGKTQAHNLALLKNISVFHGLGCPILLGVSRKGFIGRIGEEPVAARRAPGSIAVGLAALAQGVQLLRVHDVRETVQALRLWQAVR